MTKLVEDLQAFIAGAVSPAGGVWYGMNTSQPAPSGRPVMPFVTWNRIVSTDNVSLGGPSDLQNTRIQIDAVGDRLSDVEALIDALDVAFAAQAAAFAAGTPGAIANVPISSQDLYEDAIKAFRRVRDYSVWATN